MATILCIDSSNATIQALLDDGHDVNACSMGYTNGIPNLFFPPHEADLIVIDLTDPACYNSTHWGPGKNDNNHCTLVDNPTESYMVGRDGSTTPVFKIIHEKYMRRRPPGTFGSMDVISAVARAGVPLVIFLNPAWIRHIGSYTPDFCTFGWRFAKTSAKKLQLTAPGESILAYIRETANTDFELPVGFKIISGPTALSSFAATSTLNMVVTPLVVNAVHDTFSQAVRIGVGGIWLLPKYQSNAAAARVIASIIPMLKDAVLSMDTQPATIDPIPSIERAVAFDKAVKDFLTLTKQSKPPPPAPKHVAKKSKSSPRTDSHRDMFVSHASEDKLTIARPLADALSAAGYTVWFDEYELTLGDNIRRRIEEGLQSSTFGVVILSTAFFEKKWPQAELDGLFNLEKPNEKKILPIWHDVSEVEVRANSPILAGRYAESSSKGIDALVQAIRKAIDTQLSATRKGA